MTMLYPLVALVCGFEKSGTTLLNEILRRHPDMDSGFEGGVLLGSSPRQFSKIQPYQAFFRKCWELSKDDMRYLSDTDDWGEFYRRARSKSPVIVNKSVRIFDKTPKYMLHLADVLQRAPGIPCIVNVRDPRALMLSWARWSGFKEAPEAWILENFEMNCDRYLSYARGYSNALVEHQERLFLNQFEILCTSPQQQLELIFDFLGLEFDESYMNFSSKHFVYGNTVSDSYLYPYRGVLSDSACNKILEGVCEYSEWFYDPC